MCSSDLDYKKMSTLEAATIHGFLGSGQPGFLEIKPFGSNCQIDGCGHALQMYYLAWIYNVLPMVFLGNNLNILWQNVLYSNSAGGYLITVTCVV